MTMIRTSGVLFASFLLLGACAGEDPDADTAALSDTTEAGGMGGMQGMEGMEGMEGMQGMSGMQDGAMMTQMMSHMQMMQGTSADSMMAMMPAHRQMAANMLAQMNREMRDMGMAADSQWNATVDSLRSDLTHMPEMSGTELRTLMPAHHDRMMRLMEMHRTMMSKMPM